MEVNERIRIFDKESASYSKATCVSVRRKRKVKHDSFFKYKLKLKKDGSIVETRLGSELKWKRHKNKDKHEHQSSSLVSQVVSAGGIRRLLE